tara:strand:- start:5667 stop:5990 length:324 start_codon:yes stop_codon:yes gene_type:complete
MSGVLLENAFQTGIPANAAILGTGAMNKGLLLQVREAHTAETSQLGGHFKVVSGNVSTLVAQLRLSSENAKNLHDTFAPNSQARFESLASLTNGEKLLDLTQWSVVV